MLRPNCTLLAILPAFYSFPVLGQETPFELPPIVLSVHHWDELASQAATSATVLTLEDRSGAPKRDLEAVTERSANVVSQRANSGERLVVRGISSFDNALADPVGYRVNGVSLPLGTIQLPHFFAADQVTLLKGPQGTTIGRNSEAGLLSYDTIAPGILGGWRAEIGASGSDVSASPLGATRLYSAIEGPIRFVLLDWALETGLFDICAEGRTAEAVADANDLDAGQIALILRALVAAGFMKQTAEVFRTAPDILPFVTAKGPYSLRENLRAMAQLRHAGLDGIDALLRADRPAPARPLFDDAHWDAAHGSLRAFHEALAADVFETCLTRLPEWTQARSFLEIGPGSAVLTRRLLALRPDMRITLQDLLPVADRIRADAVDLSIDVIAGSYNDRLPDGPFDIIWCSLSLYFRNSGLQPLIDRLAARLAPNGVLVSFHEALHDFRTGPSEHVIGRLMPSLRQGDMSFAEGEIADSMSAAGLVGLESRPVSTPFGRFRLDLARRKE